MIRTLARTYPVTIAITLLSVITMAVPGLTNFFELDYSQVLLGQGWRCITGHWTHYDLSHLFWDLLMFVVLSASCERKCGRSYVGWMMASLMFITAAIHLACPEISNYRGLSGIDTGLFVWLAIDQIRSSFRRQDRTFAALITIAIIGLFGKLIYEATTGQTLFVDSSTFTPLVESHLAGVLTGIVCASATATTPNESKPGLLTTEPQVNLTMSKGD